METRKQMLFSYRGEIENKHFFSKIYLKNLYAPNKFGPMKESSSACICHTQSPQFLNSLQGIRPSMTL